MHTYEYMAKWEEAEKKNFPTKKNTEQNVKEHKHGNV